MQQTPALRSPRPTGRPSRQRALQGGERNLLKMLSVAVQALSTLGSCYRAFASCRPQRSALRSPVSELNIPGDGQAVSAIDVAGCQFCLRGALREPVKAVQGILRAEAAGADVNDIVAGWQFNA